MDEELISQPIDEIKREEYLTLAQAARISGYQQDYLGQLAREGKLKVIKSGHNWITTKTALDNFSTAHKPPVPVSQEQTKPKVEEPKLETVPIPEPPKDVPEIISDPYAIPLQTLVSEEPLTHTPTIPLNV